jgi:hypothetical protein
MTRKVMALLVLALLAITLPVSAAEKTYPMRITITGPDGDPLATATVTVYFVNGTKVGTNTTTSTGRTTIYVKEDGTYLIYIQKGFSAVNITNYATTSPNITISLADYCQANITASLPKVLLFPAPKVNVKYLPGDANVWLTAVANETVYVPKDFSITISYPENITGLLYRYVLSNITANGALVDNNSSLSISEDTEIIGAYTSSYYLSTEQMILIGIAIVIIAAVAVVAVTGRKRAMQIISDTAEEYRRFVKRKHHGESMLVHKIDDAEEGSFVKKKR